MFVCKISKNYDDTSTDDQIYTPTLTSLDTIFEVGPSKLQISTCNLIRFYDNI